MHCHPPPKSVETHRTSYATVTITEHDAGRSVTLGQGETLLVRLAANRTTGYRWRPSSTPNGHLSTPRKPEDYLPDPTLPGIAGAGGVEIWKLLARRPGKVTLRFDYRRPWERRGHAETRSLSFDIHVR